MFLSFLIFTPILRNLANISLLHNSVHFSPFSSNFADYDRMLSIFKILVSIVCHLADFTSISSNFAVFASISHEPGGFIPMLLNFNSFDNFAPILRNFTVLDPKCNFAYFVPILSSSVNFGTILFSFCGLCVNFR